MATVDDIVRVSGASRSTVFRYLSGNSVRAASREAIQSAIRQLDFRHEEKHRRSDINIEISVRKDFEGFDVHAKAVAGVMNRAAALGLNVILHAGAELGLRHGRARKGPDTRSGVIIIGKSRKEEDAELADLRRAGIPCIFINRIFHDPSVSWISINLRQAAFEMVSALIRQGHTRIATWGRLESYRLDAEKLAGFRDAFAHAGLSVPDLIFDDQQVGDLEDFVPALFASERRPTAWFGMTDEYAMRLAKVVRELGFRIPEDLSVVGMDDNEAAQLFHPPLTTVRIPFNRAGVLAVDLLLRLIDNPDQTATHLVLAHEIVTRESSLTLSK